MSARKDRALLRLIDRHIAKRRGMRVYYIAVGGDTMAEHCSERIAALQAERAECLRRLEPHTPMPRAVVRLQEVARAGGWG